MNNYFIRVLKYVPFILKKSIFDLKSYLYFIWTIKTSKRVRVVIGAGNTKYPGWISTEQFFFDITKKFHWSTYFKNKILDKIMAEHVFEHLTIDEIKSSLLCAKSYMDKHSTFRIAVPDGYHPSKYVIELVKPGGIDIGSSDHKILFNIDLIEKIAKDIGFKVKKVEFFDKKGIFHSNEYNELNGYIMRSFKHYKGRFTKDSNEYNKLVFSTPNKLRYQFSRKNLSYTSLIVDLSL